jgi:hypothetical protein
MSGEFDGNAAPPPPFDPSGAGAPPPPPGYTPYSPGDPSAAGWDVPNQTKKKFPTRVVVSVAVVVALLAIGFVSDYMRKHADPFNTPQTIGNGTLMTDAESAKTAKEMKDNLKNVHRAVSGVYAIDGQPAFILVAGDSDDPNAKKIYEDFKDEAGDEGVTMGPTSTYGKVLCAPFKAQDTPGVACFWGSKKSDGVLMHFGTDDPAEAGRLTQLAWDGVES